MGLLPSEDISEFIPVWTTLSLFQLPKIPLHVEALQISIFYPIIKWGLTVASSILFACSFGLKFGAFDQAIYILPGLQIQNPDFLANDWYVSEVTHHHHFFSLLIYILAEIGSIEWTTSICHLLFMVGVALATYVFSKSLYQSFEAFVIALVLLHLAMGNLKLLSHPFFTPWLAPTGVASACFLIGVSLLVVSLPERKSGIVYAGFFLGCAATIHGTFLFLQPLFFSVFWFSIRKHLAPNLPLVFGVVYGVVTLPVSIIVLMQFVFPEFDKDSIDALDFMARLRIPHHYLPQEWTFEEYRPFVIHCLLGILGVLIRKPEGVKSQYIIGVFWALGFISLGIFVFTVVYFTPYVALLQAFRFVAFLSYFGLLLFAGGIASILRFKNKLSIQNFCMVGLGLVGIYTLNNYLALFLFFTVFLVFVLNTFQTIYRRKMWKQALIVSVCIAFLFGEAIAKLPLTTDSLVDLGHQRMLLNWVRSSTSQDAIFVVPPDGFLRFRLFAQRAIVVDWKGSPYYSEESREWRKRLRCITNVNDFSSHEKRFKGYVGLTIERLLFLSQEYGAEYVIVFEGNHKSDLKVLEKVYSDGVFGIYRIFPIPIEVQEL